MPKSNTYDEFVDKFKPKKTTDDCMTPPKVYEAVKDWACKEYGIAQESIVRPFWPGGDYENFDYPPGCVVLDNPPFSILSNICDFYVSRGIQFFLFAPTLTLFCGKAWASINHIAAYAEVVYENGARVNTSFVTSFGGDVVAMSAPELTRAVTEAVKEIRKEKVKTLPKYTYPDNVLTAPVLGRYSKYGVDFKVRRSDCVRIPALDAQKEKGKSIFGSGLLLSDRSAAEKAAAEKAAAEKVAAEKWELSERELTVVESLG